MLELSKVKQHCRIDEDFTEDDVLLGTYITASVSYVEEWTRRKLYPTPDTQGYEEDEDHLLLTGSVEAAMLMLVAFWYENREPISLGEATQTPFAVEALLQPYRIYGL